MNAAGSVLVDTSVVVVAYLRGDQALPQNFARFSTVCIPWVVLSLDLGVLLGCVFVSRKPKQLFIAMATIQKAFI